MSEAGRCLVTGAGGFIGAALVRRLAGDYSEVWRLVRPGAATAGAPCTLAADLAAEAPALGNCPPFAAIFHLAGRAHQVDFRSTEQAEHELANVAGTRHLMHAARANGAGRVVFASSVAAMGAATPAQLDESAPAIPVSAYGRTKLLAEELVLGARAVGGPDGVVLRFPLVYGPGQKGNLDRLLRVIVRRRFPPPPKSLNRRSALHVDDAVEALRLAARHAAAAGRVFLVCEPEANSTRSIYEWSCQALGRRPAGWGLPAPAWRGLGNLGDGVARLLGRRVGFDSTAVERLLGDAWYSAARIERELGWQARRRLRDELPHILAGLAGTLPPAAGSPPESRESSRLGAD